MSWLKPRLSHSWEHHVTSIHPFKRFGEMHVAYAQVPVRMSWLTPSTEITAPGIPFPCKSLTMPLMPRWTCQENMTRRGVSSPTGPAAGSQPVCSVEGHGCYGVRFSTKLELVYLVLQDAHDLERRGKGSREVPSVCSRASFLPGCEQNLSGHPLELPPGDTLPPAAVTRHLL